MVNGNEACVKRTDNPETLDLTDCDTSDWDCFDGIMDISNVIIKLFDIILRRIFSVKESHFTYPSLITTLLMDKERCLVAFIQMKTNIKHI